MKKTFFLLALLTLCFVVAESSTSHGSAAAARTVAEEGKGCAVPKEWGSLKGVADRGIAFEDSRGNIRVVDLGPCMRGETQLIVMINRQ